MPSLGMEGSHSLDNKTIDEKVTKVSPGNYALGRRDENGTFLVSYIGRADNDLNSELKSWVGKTNKPLFKFRYAISARDAFGIECENYHDFDREGKGKHPVRPKGTNWKCPRCNFYK
jgi:hypothetical protein